MVYVWLNRTYLMYNNILYVSKIVLATAWYVKSVYSDVPLHSIYIDILQFFFTKHNNSKIFKSNQCAIYIFFITR